MIGSRTTALALAALLAGAGGAFAKSADDYFHGGAYQYVAGKHQQALIEVEEGLRQYPDDARLQKLADQLRKMKDQQNPSGGNGKGNDKKNDPKKDKGDDKKDPGKDKQDGGKKPDDKNGKDPKDPPPPKDGDDKNVKGGKNPAGAPPPGQMSEEDAKRLLNSFADDEKKEQRERQKLLRKRLQSDQDW